MSIASFNGPNGATPYAGVTFDAQGNLYGTTLYGGSDDGGTAWEILKGSSTTTTLASFSSPITNNASGPYGGVTLDAQGNLYGTTAFGGVNDDGTVWEIVKGSHVVTTLATFDSANGQHPFGGVMMDAQGNLFGTTANGGAGNDGTVWELAKGSSTISPLAAFSGPNGANPYSALTFDAQGNLYGTTYFGGANSDGTVFVIAKGSGLIGTIASFNGSNGANPIAGVKIDAQGNLYGTTVAGGSPVSTGTVWEIAKGGSTITTLAVFTGPDGQQPAGDVTLDAQGNRYGTTFKAGPTGYGTVWEIANGSSVLRTLAAFDGVNGANPYAGLTLGPNGNLYGTALDGGDAGDGSVFQLVPEPSSLVLGGIALAIGAVGWASGRARHRRQAT
jgi:uncharacterized repeat protein (TIGR03803 family)